MDTIYKYLMNMCHTSVYNRTLNCTIQEIFIMIITHRVAPRSSTLAAFIYEFSTTSFIYEFSTTSFIYEFSTTSFIYEFLWEHILALNNKNQSSFQPTHFFLKQFLHQVILSEWLSLAQVILGLRGGMLLGGGGRGGGVQEKKKIKKIKMLMF